MLVSVSIVSHKHGPMIKSLVDKLLTFACVKQIILTINVPEQYPIFYDRRVSIIVNSRPKGFGENHNDAFKLTTADFFCVLNPDIVFETDPFPILMRSFSKDSIALVAPLIINSTGAREDSMRTFLTPYRLFIRAFSKGSGEFDSNTPKVNIWPDWVAGMFMLFRSSAYTTVGGFDTKYYMYCEDADICTRLWLSGFSVLGCLDVSVIHDAQRASHRSLNHLSWHLKSLLRYFFVHSFRLPKKRIARCV